MTLVGHPPKSLASRATLADRAPRLVDRAAEVVDRAAAVRTKGAAARIAPR